MDLLVLSEHEVERLLTMPECIEVMEATMAGLARGEFAQPLRSLVRPDGAAGFLGLMPAYRGGDKPLFGLKEVCVFPRNPARGLDTHLGAVILHSGETGEPLAVINAAAITAIRTAAVSAVATKHLARADAAVLAIIGSGAQARSHLRAIPAVRDIKEIRVASRTRAKAEVIAAEDKRARAVDTVENAVRGADIVVTATSAREPIMEREWLAPGVHINAVGACVPAARELDSATVAGAALYVDRRESAYNEAGDYLIPLKEGLITAQHIRGEIGEVIIGTAEGRKSNEDTTLFKSLGVAVEDLASAAFLYEKATRLGVGSRVPF